LRDEQDRPWGPGRSTPEICVKSQRYSDGMFDVSADALGWIVAVAFIAIVAAVGFWLWR
jgi:hypothetical protein